MCGKKVLVGYMSQSGNTKKVAEAIYNKIQCEKEIVNINEVESLDEYDMAFLGFPVIQMGPPAKAVDFLGKETKDKKIALFVTHGAGKTLPPLQGWLQKYKDACAGELLGLYNCQGEVSQNIRDVMAKSDKPELQMFAKMAGMADGQPDKASLEAAGGFALSILEEL